MKPSRAALLATLVVMVASALWGFWLEPASLRVQEVDMPVAWPSPRPLRVAVLSDLHVGAPYHGVRRLRDTVARTNATRPELICILGDFVTTGVVGGSFVPPEPIAAELQALRAPAGVVAVLGNHDSSFDGPRVERALTDAGIRVLEDTAIRLTTASGPIWIAGVSDPWTGRDDVRRAVSAVTDDKAPVILIAHNPRAFRYAPERVVLTLAGHTHGGQVRLPLIGAPIADLRFRRGYAAGHVIEGNRHLFVSTGIGTSTLPVRFGVPPTIFVLTLRSP
ncbi:MAG: metallophosphoesterase [Gemmatimonadales bacterium]